MNAGCIHEFWVRRAREGAQLSGGCCFGCAWHLAVARISCQCEINVGGALSTAAVAVPAGSVSTNDRLGHATLVGTIRLSVLLASRASLQHGTQPVCRDCEFVAALIIIA